MRKQQQQEAEMRKSDTLVFWLLNVCIWRGRAPQKSQGGLTGPAQAWERGQEVTGFWLKHPPAAQLSPETREVRT